MAPQKGKSSKQLTPYQAKDSFAKNKARKILKHIKKHPNDSVAATALPLASSAPFRKKPKAKLGWVSASPDLVSAIRSQFNTPTKAAVNSYVAALTLSKKVARVASYQFKKAGK
jgi:hypothetical protein